MSHNKSQAKKPDNFKWEAKKLSRICKHLIHSVMAFSVSLHECADDFSHRGGLSQSCKWGKGVLLLSHKSTEPFSVYFAHFLRKGPPLETAKSFLRLHVVS